MARMIDADDAVQNLMARKWESGSDAFMAYEAIQNAPTIDPVRHAKWVCDKGVSACSVCGGEQRYNDWDELEFTPWCHNCGARMDAEEGEANG